MQIPGDFVVFRPDSDTNWCWGIRSPLDGEMVVLSSRKGFSTIDEAIGDAAAQIYWLGQTAEDIIDSVGNPIVEDGDEVTFPNGTTRSLREMLGSS